MFRLTPQSTTTIVRLPVPGYRWIQGRLHRPLGTDPDRQGPRVDSLQGGRLVAPQELAQGHRALRMARGRARLLDDEPGRLDRLGFHRAWVDSVVPDQRVGHHEDLSAVRRIR